MPHLGAKVQVNRKVTTMTTEATRARRSNGPLGFLWFLAIAGIVAGIIMLVIDETFGGTLGIGIGFQAMLLALTVQAVRHQY